MKAPLGAGVVFRIGKGDPRKTKRRKPDENEENEVLPMILGRGRFWRDSALRDWGAEPSHKTVWRSAITVFMGIIKDKDQTLRTSAADKP